jgi:HK97 family phage major capsid protein
MVMTNAELLRKATGVVATTDLSAGSGLLSPEQSSDFLDQVYDATPFSQAQRNLRRRSAEGSINKIGIGGRILRKKNEGVDDSTLVKPDYGEVEYAVRRYRADTEINEEVFEDNIEGEGFEDHWIGLVTGQIGRDLEDLHFNGDESSSDLFVKLNEGWLEQLVTANAHRVNGGSIDSGAVAKGLFFAGLEAMPSKFKQNGRLRWIGNPSVFERYLEGLTERATAAGDAALLGEQLRLPGAIPKLEVPAMPTDRLILGDPANFIVVTRRDVRYRKTTEGREAVRQDKRFYAWFLATDPIIEETDAIVDVYGVDTAAAFPS